MKRRQGFVGPAILFNMGFLSVEERGNLLRRQSLDTEQVTMRIVNIGRARVH